MFIIHDTQQHKCPPAAFYTLQKKLKKIKTPHLTALDSELPRFFMFLPNALYELPGRLGF